jgi:hypothetical protein
VDQVVVDQVELFVKQEEQEILLPLVQHKGKMEEIQVLRVHLLMVVLVVVAVQQKQV